jgi:iron complex outermembrane receptor protein
MLNKLIMNLKLSFLDLKKQWLILILLSSFFQFSYSNDLTSKKSSQQQNVHGTITDSNNVSLPGVNIIIQGTTSGTQTDMDGKYTINVGQGDVLVFSYIGMKTQKITFDGKVTLINVILQEDAESLDAIVIRGFRASQLRAINVKRKATSVIEAITPADLGSFSDENIADALQRVPGLQVERNDSGNGGGDRVSIRGVGPQFVNVTINGRTPLSSGTEGIEELRQFNLEVLPPEVINGAIVYKSSEARLIEPGLGGLVDFQTLRPLDVNYKNDRNFFGAINVRNEIDELSVKSNPGLNPRISAIFGGKTKDEKFAAYASFLTSSGPRTFDGMFNRAGTADIMEDTNSDGVFDVANGDILHEDVQVSGFPTFNPIVEERERLAITSAIQWRPSDNLEIVVDVLKSDFNNRSFRSLYRPFLNNVYSNVFAPGNVDVRDGVLRSYNSEGSFSATTGAPTDEATIRYQSTGYDNLSSNIMGGLNVKWEKNGWLILADYSMSNIEFNQRLTVAGLRNVTVPNLTYDLNGELPIVLFDQNAANDFNNATILPNYFNWDRRLDGDNNAFRLDFKKELNDNFALRFGGRFNSNSVESRHAEGGGTGHNDEYLDAESHYDRYVSPSSRDFLDGQNIGNNRWSDMNHELIRSDFPELYGKKAGSSLEGDLFNVTDGDLPLSRGRSFEVKEKSTSIYSQLDLKVDLGEETSLSGNFGLRAINSRVNSRAFSSAVITDPAQSIQEVVLTDVQSTNSSDRWDFTPSLNLSFNFSNKISYRMSIVKTISRPSYTDLAPRNFISAINPNSPAFGSENGTVAVSNPELKPFSTWQFDNTVEWYNKSGGAVVLSLFYKEISDYIINQTTLNTNLSDAGDLGFEGLPAGLDTGQSYDISKPENYTGAQIFGYEFGFIQPLSFISESLKNFGLQANYTFVASNFDKELSATDNQFPGSSKHNFNTVFYYENRKIGARIAYSARSNYLRNIGGLADARGNDTFTEGVDQLNFRVNYNIFDSLQLSASAENITRTGRRDYLLNDPSVFNRVTGKGSVWTIGLRYNF